MAENDPNIIIDEDQYEERVSSFFPLSHLLNRFFFMVALFARSGFATVGDDIIKCTECGRQHQINEVIQTDSNNVQWHELHCPFLMARKPCWFCSATFFNWATFQCPRCNINANSDKAFSESTCVICGTIVNLETDNYERCARCSGIICGECVATRRGHVHADGERKAF
uniref:uncharacterized protein LOC120334411 n=1 Tax=Styela clava TaxID=7725 RepID=UPI001939D672|nr:uncharacterized protein LOC120334411 [Styela clava]XP_039257862.1 uncharacterized protein LOC120334411 [Styela clava]XP_039257863.1 uncharacterized protein LOC120334411 [Styela clava]